MSTKHKPGIWSFATKEEKAIHEHLSEVLLEAEQIIAQSIQVMARLSAFNGRVSALRTRLQIAENDWVASLKARKEDSEGSSQ